MEILLCNKLQYNFQGNEEKKNSTEIYFLKLHELLGDFQKKIKGLEGSSWIQKNSIHLN